MPISSWPWCRAPRRPTSHCCSTRAWSPRPAARGPPPRRRLPRLPCCCSGRGACRARARQEEESALGYRELYDSLNALSKEQLGLFKGYKFALDIEKASGLEGLREVAQRLIEEVRRVRANPPRRWCGARWACAAERGARPHPSAEKTLQPARQRLGLVVVQHVPGRREHVALDLGTAARRVSNSLRG